MSEGSSSPISGKIVANVGAIEFTKDDSSLEVTVTTSSQTLEELLGTALPADVLAVTVNVGGATIRYNPAGAADATHAALPSVYTLCGTKAVLDVAEFYAASSLAMGVIVHVPAYTEGAR